MKIYDCFTFWNENSMLEARIEYLYPFIDWFVIVESKTQHDGSFKEFTVNKERLKQYWNKIIYIQDTADISPGSSGWGVENHHRNCITQGLIDASPEDIIIIGDLDEIWATKYIEFLKSNRFQHGQAYGFLCDFYNYFFNCFCPLNPCIGSVVCRKSTLDLSSPQHMRNIKDKLPR